MAQKQVFSSFLDKATDQKIDRLGDIRHENGKTYKYVRFSGSVNKGEVVAYTTGDPLVVETSSANNRVTAGVSNVDAANDQYGWVVIRGLIETTQDMGLFSRGSALTRSTSSSGFASVKDGHDQQEIGVVESGSNPGVIFVTCPE